MSDQVQRTIWSIRSNEEYKELVNAHKLGEFKYPHGTDIDTEVRIYYPSRMMGYTPFKRFRYIDGRFVDCKLHGNPAILQKHIVDIQKEGVDFSRRQSELRKKEKAERERHDAARLADAEQKIKEQQEERDRHDAARLADAEQKIKEQQEERERHDATRLADAERKRKKEQQEQQEIAEWEAVCQIDSQKQCDGDSTASQDNINLERAILASKLKDRIRLENEKNSNRMRTIRPLSLNAQRTAPRLVMMWYQRHVPLTTQRRRITQNPLSLVVTT